MDDDADIAEALIIAIQRNEELQETIDLMKAREETNTHRLEEIIAQLEMRLEVTRQMSRQREEALVLEMKHSEETFRKEIDKIYQTWKEEREERTACSDQIVEEMEKELRNNREEMCEKMDKLRAEHISNLAKAHKDYETLNENCKMEVTRLRREMEEQQELSGKKILELTAKNNEKLLELSNRLAISEGSKLKDQESRREELRKANDDYNTLQETFKYEISKLQKEQVEIIRENAMKDAEVASKMLELSERKNEQLFYLASRSAQSEMIKMKEHSEMLYSSKINEETSLMKELKSSLLDNAMQCREYWVQLEFSSDDSDEIKGKIIDTSQAMDKNVNDLLKTIDNCRSLGDQKKSWKECLLKLISEITKYSKSVRREIRDQEITRTRLREMEDDCEKVHELIHVLPELDAETLESLIIRSAQRTIENVKMNGLREAMESIQLGEKETIRESGSEPIVEEPL